MISIRKETIVAWPKFTEDEIRLIRKIYEKNWSRMTVDYMIRNPYSGYAYAFTVLTLVVHNDCEELVKDWHLYEELISEIVKYLTELEESDEEYARVKKLWHDIMTIKGMNKEDHIVREDV